MMIEIQSQSLFPVFRSNIIWFMPFIVGSIVDQYLDCPKFIFNY